MKNVKLDWLLEIDNLSIFSVKQNFVADIDSILVSAFSTKSFCRDRVTFKEDNKIIIDSRAEYKEDKYLLVSDNRTYDAFEDETCKDSKK